VGGAIGIGQDLVIGGDLERANDLVSSFPPIHIACNGCSGIDGRYNFWGTTDEEEIEDLLGGSTSFLDYEPWTDREHSGLYGTSVGVAENIESGDLREIRFAVDPPSPTPTRSGVTMRYSLPRRSAVKWTLYDVRGRRIRRGEVGTMPPGSHRVWIAMKDLADGIYFIQFEGGEFREIARVVLVK